MTERFTRYTCALFLIIALAASTAGAQHEEHSGESMPLYTDILGDFVRPVSTSSEEAQAYFNQGMRLKYAFATRDAVNSFREAQRHDPTCAMCYWGEAWASGPYLNSSGGNTEQAHAAVQRALQLAENHALPVERALIEAMSRRYGEDSVHSTAYAEAMREVYEAFPEDPDVGTLYGEALFLLEPRRGSRNINDPAVKRIHRVFEGVLNADIRHPGACHLYVHATESTSQPKKAEPCAEYLGEAIPGVSHINHMPSHTWSQTGRWADAVEANLRAVETDRRASAGEGFAVYPTHNLHMLANMASMDGQGAVAVQAGADYARMTGNSMYHVLTLVRFGRFDEISAVADRPGDKIGAGMWDFAHGYTRLRKGDIDSARQYLDHVLAAASSSQAMFRVHPAEHLLGTLGGILEGEIHREAGDTDAAIVSFARAVSLEDELMWDEPEPLPFASRHWLGAALLEAERPEEAERIYREDLRHDPENGWSLFGLRQALKAQGKPVANVSEAFEAAWTRSDTKINASRF